MFWPARAIVRWRYGASFPLSERQATTYRLAHIGSLLVLAYLGGWALTITTVSSNLAALTPALDPRIRVLQIAQLVLYAAFALSVWNAAVVWSGRRSWFGKTWSVLLPASIAIVIWFAAIAGLLSFSLNLLDHEAIKLDSPSWGAKILHALRDAAFGHPQDEAILDYCFLL